MGSLESRYILNISRDGMHYCRIEMHINITSEILKKCKEIRARFPKEEGFKLDLTYWAIAGEKIDF